MKTGSNEKILVFLKDLKENNDRDWFTKNRTRYDEAQKTFESFINQLIPEIRSFDASIDLITAKDCIFRIYRDVRFSANKAPYKTNFGAYIARGGKKSTWAGYYVHFEPGSCMLAGGMYMPPTDQLKKARQEVYFNSTELKRIMSDETFTTYYNGLDDEYKMTRPPKEFPPDFPDIDLLKYKSYIVGQMVIDELATSDEFLYHALGAFRAMFPFNSFLNRIFI